VRQDTLESPAGIERWVRLLARLLRDLVADAALRQGRDDPEGAWRSANPR
jgi:hypothetical protein